MGPYAWQRLDQTGMGNSRKEPPGTKQNQPLVEHVSWVPTPCSTWGRGGLKLWLYDDLNGLPRSKEVFQSIEDDPCLTCRLPRPRSTAGKILQHAISVTNDLLERWRPMIFKFGITHDASYRWNNCRYGYQYSPEKFEKMIVLYAASDPHGPAFLEAALINHFASGLATIAFSNQCIDPLQNA